MNAKYFHKAELIISIVTVRLTVFKLINIDAMETWGFMTYLTNF